MAKIPGKARDRAAIADEQSKTPYSVTLFFVFLMQALSWNADIWQSCVACLIYARKESVWTYWLSVNVRSELITALSSSFVMLIGIAAGLLLPGNAKCTTSRDNKCGFILHKCDLMYNTHRLQQS